MGRTKRVRKRRVDNQNTLSHEIKAEIINLKRWMNKSGWRNESSLQIKEFLLSGRGVSSKKRINTNSALIEIPLNLLITPKELDMEGLKNNGELKTQDLLSIFLILEKHKMVISETKWSFYIQSLPATTPNLPWLNCADEAQLFLPKSLKQKFLKCQLKFEESWGRVKKSIGSLCCTCCKGRLDGVISLNTFTWGYVMVNTRAVYLEPGVISPKNIDAPEMLSDDLSMALCPYLDMFNHSTSVDTKMEISGDKYKLITLTTFKANEEIFISYGPHDNTTLLCEYGFFLPHNENDRVYFELQEIIASLNKAGFKVRNEDYKIVKEKFVEQLFVANQGISLNLKALMYIISYGCFNWNKIYNEEYSVDEFRTISSLVKITMADYVERLDFCLVNNSKKILLDYLEYLKSYCCDIDKKLV